ncbi:hypothetical protein RCL1_008481 [Eukaryota sp. TZLM3-RCL]
MTTTISEGAVSVVVGSDVFFNKVQTFNRDITLLSIRAFDVVRKRAWKRDVPPRKLRILDALSASGLRAMRFAKELREDEVHSVIANDISPAACGQIQQSIQLNNLSSTVTCINSDANLLMNLAGCGASPFSPIPLHVNPSPETLSIKKDTQSPDWDASFFDVIDLDPFGSASPFIDSAIAAVRPGGMLCITSTDQAVLSGQYTDKCLMKYQSLPMHISCCKESSVRSLLNSIAFAAAKKDCVIVPLLSLNVDFYDRVFVRVEKRGNPKSMATRLVRTVFCNTCHTVLY